MIVVILLLLFIGIYGCLFAIRSLRWLGFVQQKEYRIDRLQSFLFSEEGQQEVFKLLPVKHELSRTGLKRPKITLRSTFVAVTLLLLVSVLFVLGLFWWIEVIWMLALWLVMLYILLPVLAIIAIAPSAVMVRLKVWSQLYRANRLFRKHQPVVIGIGGSYGKTSTKFLLKALLEEKHSVFVTPRSYNTTYSIANSIVKNYTGQEIAIIEYGAYKVGEIEYLTKWLPPMEAVITGLTEQHLSLFGSLDSSVLAESELVTAIPKEGKVYFNAADTGAEHIVMVGSQSKDIAAIPYKVGTDISNLQTDSHGRLRFTYGKMQVQTHLVGKHYGANIAGAILVAKEHGVSVAQIKKALENFDPSENFVRSYKNKKGVWILDDSGTSNPVGFAATIQIASDFSEKNKVLLTPGIVDLGAESEKIHTELARAADTVFDTILYVGVDGKEAFEEIMPNKLFSNREIVEQVLNELDNGDLLVIEGKMPGWIEELI